MQSLVSHKNNADQFAKVDQFGREANTRYAQNQNLQQTQQDGNFRIVNFTKTNDGIELQLDPASMGKVQIKLETSAEGKVTLAIIAEKPETLESLKNDSSSIQKILDDNGMSSDSSSMSFNLQQGGGNQGNNGDGFKFNDSGRDIAFNLEQELNDNIKDVSISSTGALYRDLSGVGMLNIVV